MDLSTAKAVVTGGASGLGFATAKAVVDAGGHVALFDVNGEQGEAAAAGAFTLGRFRAVRELSHDDDLDGGS